MNPSTSPQPSVPLSLSAWLAQAQDRHADAPQAVADGLRERAATLPADEDGAQALRLAEHVWLAHLGDPAGLAALIVALPAAAWSGGAAQPDASPAVAQARIAWALAMLAGQAAPPLALAARWRALQNVVLALARQGRYAQAEAWLLADEAAAAACAASDAGRAYAASANNVAQDLGAGPRGDAARDRLMLVAAHLSQRAWASAGTWLYQERAEYRLALCHAVLGQGEAALVHARRCLAACEAGDGQHPADAVEHFFAWEALARAHHAAGDAAGAAAAAKRMAALLPNIDEADGLRAWCEQALRDLPCA